MTDLIDTIHKIERLEIADNLDYINKEMKGWNKTNFEPVNYEVTVIRKQTEDDKLIKRK